MKLRFRQVHLDFHTSELIRDVGSAFSKDNFQAALKTGHIDSITVFSKCHHGLSYHDTKVGIRHPHLTKPLLPLMLEAAREIGVNTPIYLSAGLDEAMLKKHPDWKVQIADVPYQPFKAGFKHVCFNTPYLDYLCAQIDEVLTLFPGNGIFLDIINRRMCRCSYCVFGMLAAGLDPEKESDLTEYQTGVLLKYYRATTETVRRHGKDIPLFHNGGHITRGYKEILKYQTHLELESLPTGGWGYDHFPLSARYAVNTGRDFLGMTGKFHTTWGEFGGFKHVNALRYETAAMIANGAKCSVGDQLHPCGKMDMATYELIGAAYNDVEKLEQYCTDTVTQSEIAILSVESLNACLANHWNPVFPDEGACRMLLESQVMFDVIDTDADFSRYRLLILPDEVTVNEKLALALNRFLAGGGRLILSGTSGLDNLKEKYNINTCLLPLGISPWNNDYITVRKKLESGSVASQFVTYKNALMIDPQGAEILADVQQPYFNRSYDHFCSHQHTPHEKKADYPAVIRDKNIIVFAHPVFSMYRISGQMLFRNMVRCALRLLLGEMQFESNMPSTARMSYMRQNNRLLLHLLNAVPVSRGGNGDWPMEKAIEVIEDCIPLHEIKISVAVPLKVKRVYNITGNTELEHTQKNNRVFFTLPYMEHHALIMME